jgi:hypothetical protein
LLRMKKLRSIITGVFGFALVSMATDYTWTGPLTGGTWDTTSGSWSAGCPGWSYESNSIPALTNIAVFNTSGLQATVSGTVYPNGLRVRGGSQLTIPNEASVTNTSWLSLNGNSKILLANGGTLYSRAANEGFNDNQQGNTTFTFASADEPSPGGTVMLETTGEFRMNKVNVSDYKVILDNVTLLNNSGDGNGFQVARGGARNYLIITNGATFKNVRSGKTLTIGIDGSGQNVISIHSNSVMNLNNGNMRMKGGSGQDQRVWINGGILDQPGGLCLQQLQPACRECGHHQSGEGLLDGFDGDGRLQLHHPCHRHEFALASCRRQPDHRGFGKKRQPCRGRHCRMR